MVLGAIGLVCALQLLLLRSPVPWDSALDVPLAACLCWGAALAALIAANADAAWRAVGSFSAAAAAFLLARRVGARPGIETVYLAICITLFVSALLVLLEAFGEIPFISAVGRRPGAMLGNRNLAARVACLSLPLLWRQLVLSDRRAIRRAIAVMVAVIGAAIVVARSRGAWLVAAGLVTALPAATWWLADVRFAERSRAAAGWWIAAVAIGGAAAIFLPNQLGWQPGDFASSARRVAEYQAGTGRGRIIQAQTTWRMIRAAPLRGVGPGNWSRVYPVYAPIGDPSVKLGAFYPAPQVPRNDLLSFTSEFGILGLALVLASAIALLARAMGMLRSSAVVIQQSGLMILATGAATALLGLFDSIVRVAPTVALVALTLGLALGEDAARTVRARTARPGSHVARQVLLIGCACASLIFMRGALRDLTALRTIRSAKTLEDLYRAVAVAPNNVEARMLLAYVLVRADRCDLAQPHLTRAALLQPFSGAVRSLGIQCDQRMHER